MTKNPNPSLNYSPSPLDRCIRFFLENKSLPWPVGVIMALVAAYLDETPVLAPKQTEISSETDFS